MPTLSPLTTCFLRALPAFPPASEFSGRSGACQTGRRSPPPLYRLCDPQTCREVNLYSGKSLPFAHSSTLVTPVIVSMYVLAVNSSSGGAYFTPSKLQDGGSIRFALLSDEPLEFFESWGTDAAGKAKPFRFDYEPTYEDVLAEMGDYTPREGRGGPGTADVKFAIACPVYNYESGKVQVLQITQKSILKEIDQISQMEDYENLLEWDFTISKKGSGLLTEYTVRPVPRKKGSQEHIDAAWLEAKSEGFDITRLLTGGNPFKAA